MTTPGACMNILEARRRKKGLGTIDNPERFLDQDFAHLKQYCTVNRMRYIDDMFPPDRRSIGKEVLHPEDMARVVWMRPGKMSSNPTFIADGVSRFDFVQGAIANCWLLAALGALTFQMPIMKQVVPHDQGFDEEYSGIFHFRFWRFGYWVDVVIDDKLPTIDGRLIFVNPKNRDEFWPCLVEKAYAKLCGSYSDMIAGNPSEALVDFTGGTHISIQLSAAPSNLFELLFRAAKSKSLMGCGTPGDILTSKALSNGLVSGHSYTVTGVKQLMSQGRQVNLVRLWNPWGQGEWNGDWSDKSPLWSGVSPADRERCLNAREDGEFWMTLEDFSRSYEDLDICCLSTDFLDGNSSCQWSASSYEDRWVAGVTAGGSLNNIETFWMNPQYRFQVEVNRETSLPTNEITMLVSLMQKADKRNRKLFKNLLIGFSVFELTDEFKSHRGKFPAAFFKRTAPVRQSTTYLDAREVTQLMALRPGEYLLVPSTSNPNDTASYFLTILSKSDVHSHDDSNGDDGDHSGDEGNIPDNTEAGQSAFDEFSDENNNVDAEQLQNLLNNKFLTGKKSGGFSLDACRSMVALMDTSITGKLNRREFLNLWRKMGAYKDHFFRTDVSQTGTLSLTELRNAVMAAGQRASDNMLALLAVRYGSTPGVVTLENFISLMLRFESMNQIFRQLSEGSSMTLIKSEWMYLYMYS